MGLSTTSFIAENIDDLPAIAEAILPIIRSNKIVALIGELGAGKTTLIKVICDKLGIEENVSSPTFSIINEYENPKGDLKVYHMDLYRIETEEELINIGFEEYLDSGQLVFIEWPDIARGLCPSNTIGIHIEIFDNSKRRVNLIEP